MSTGEPQYILKSLKHTREFKEIWRTSFCWVAATLTASCYFIQGKRNPLEKILSYDQEYQIVCTAILNILISPVEEMKAISPNQSSLLKRQTEKKKIKLETKGSAK
jgi:hypothetical protein